MILVSNNTAQTVQPGGNVLFGSQKLRRGCNEQHRDGGASVRAKRGSYVVSFTANVSGAANTQPNLAVTVDGDVLPETVMTETATAATDIRNVSCYTRFDNDQCGASFAVRNVGTTPVTIQANPAFVVERVC